MDIIPKQVDKAQTGNCLLFPSHNIVYALPDGFIEEDRKLFYEENFRDEIPAVEILTLESVALINGLLIQNKLLLSEFTHHRNNAPVSTYKSRLRLKILPKEHFEEAISGVMDWADNYFHWMTELLPRIVALNKFKPDVPVVLSERVGRIPFVLNALDLLNISFYILPTGRGVVIDKLYVCKVPHVGQFNKFLLSSFRSEVIGLVSTYRLIAPIRKIYISRSAARRRKVSNEDELWQVLQSQGFEKVELENLPWRDQVRLFREAVLVISNHGAGLSNIMFMPADSKVIELKSAKNDYWCYYSLACVCHLQYAYLLCEQSETNHRDADIRVEVDKLLRLMNIEKEVA
ncbi:MAG: hypothetical protein RLZZ172_2755 [Bacteroidota bacterium]